MIDSTFLIGVGLTTIVTSVVLYLVCVAGMGLAIMSEGQGSTKTVYSQFEYDMEMRRRECAFMSSFCMGRIGRIMTVGLLISLFVSFVTLYGAVRLNDYAQIVVIVISSVISMFIASMIVTFSASKKVYDLGTMRGLDYALTQLRRFRLQMIWPALLAGVTYSFVASGLVAMFAVSFWLYLIAAVLLAFGSLIALSMRFI